MIIAFCGPSGSGKTTFLKHALNGSNFEKKEIRVFEEDSFIMLKIAKKFIGNKKFEEYNKSKMSEEKRNNLNLFSKVSSIIYPLIVFIEYMCLYIFYNKIFTGRVLFSDRWAYDYLVTFNKNLSINNKLINYIFSNFPKPDLIFYLQIDSKTALNRNKSGKKFSKTNEEEFHKRIIDSYEKLLKDKGVLTINAIINKKENANKIIKLINDKKILSEVREIAIIGVDGAGKSTIARAMNDYCNLLGERSRVVHFYHSNILLKIFKKFHLINEQENKESKEIKIKNVKKIDRHPFIKIFLSLVHFIDSYIQYLAFRLISRRSILIFDRFFADYIISFKYYKIPKINSFNKFSPKVKNEFVILVDPKVAYSRKPEAFIDFYEYSNLEYRKYAKSEKLKIVRVDNKTPEEIVGEIINKLEV